MLLESFLRLSLRGTVLPALAAGLLAGCAGAPPSDAGVDGPAAMPSGDMMGGEFVYMADAAMLTECPGGERYPVAMRDDYILMERAYLAEPKEIGEGLYVTFDGEVTDIPAMEGDGTVRGIVVKRFIRAWPGEDCERARADASLADTFWRIVSLNGEEVDTHDGRREPHLVLRRGGESPSYSATVGCNMLSGGWSLEGDRILFQQGLSTRMACPPPLDEMEALLGRALTGIRICRIKGNTMEMCDEDGDPVALLQAVYFLTD
jgi:heat shock protein HslJ